jgi:hypothetical protein
LNELTIQFFDQYLYDDFKITLHLVLTFIRTVFPNIYFDLFLYFSTFLSTLKFIDAVEQMSAYFLYLVVSVAQN